MLRGTDWAGDYSRFSYDEALQYFQMMKEQGKPVLDDEFNLSQEIQFMLLRRFIRDSFGDGSSNAGFQIVGTGAANDLTIKGGDGTLPGAGRLYVDGIMLLLESDTTYSGQPTPGSALTTPAAARTDAVYVDCYLDEVGPATDPNMNDPTLAVETSRRLKLFWSVLVAEGSVTPVNYADANNRQHYTYQVATLNRTAQAGIDAGMVVDDRAHYGAKYALLNGDSAEKFQTAAATANVDAVNLGQADAKYATLAATTNTFTGTLYATGFESTSDPRLKRGIVRFAPSLNDLAQINIYAWNWIKGGQHSVGTMAPEVAAVLPDLVSTDPETGRAIGVDYGKTAFILARRMLDELDLHAGYIAELKVMNDALEARVADLERSARMTGR